MAEFYIKADGVLLPTPSTFRYDWEDVSSSDAGRVESGKMQKQMMGYTRALSLSWKNINTATVSAILHAVRPEYIQVTFFDPYLNKEDTMECYVGNRTAPLYNGALDIWTSLSFKLIERSLETQ